MYFYRFQTQFVVNLDISKPTSWFHLVRLRFLTHNSMWVDQSFSPHPISLKLDNLKKNLRVFFLNIGVKCVQKPSEYGLCSEIKFQFFLAKSQQEQILQKMRKKKLQKVLEAFWAQKDIAGKHLTEILVHQVCENNIENNRITTLKGSRNLR